jgi:hypothetical protein
MYPGGQMSSRISELILIILLLVLAGFTRVYYGGAAGPMFVWKSEFGFKDTLVDVPDVLKLPKTTLLQEHAQVADQLDEMGLVNEPVAVFAHRRKPAVDHFGTAQPPVSAKSPGLPELAKQKSSQEQK